MTNRELKLKLKGLQALKPAVLPNALWVAETRKALVAHMKEESPSVSQMVMPVKLPSTAMSRFMFALRPVMAMVMVAGIAVIGWAAGVSSSFGNRPGSLFKGVAEKTQLTFAATPSARAYLHLELAGRRANELAVLAESSGADRESGMLAAMNQLQQEIASVKSSLKEANSAKSSDAAAVAKAVDRKVAEINAVFNKTRGLFTPTAKTRAEQVVAAADDVSIQAVAVLVESAKTPEDKTDAATRVAEKIDSAEKDMQVASTEASEQAKEALEQAKAALASDNLAEAVTKVQESADLANATASVEEPSVQNQVPNENSNGNVPKNDNTNTDAGKIKAIGF